MRLGYFEELNQRALSQWFVLALLALAFFYRAPAYFLGYQWEPPIAFRLGKYVISLVLVMGALNIWSSRIGELTRYDFIYLGVFTLLAGQGFRTNAWDLVEGAFWPLVSFAIVRFSQPISARLISRIMGYTFWIYGFFILLQLFCLAFYGYGFMHSGDSIFNSRFGGLMVEPLSAPMMCFLFLGWAISRPKNNYIYLLCVVIFILMTHTWTAYFYIILMAALWVFYELWRNKYRWYSYGLMLLFLVILSMTIMFVHQQTETSKFLSAKWSSVELHMTYWWPSRWLWLPSEDFKFSETVWVGYVENLGILWTICFFGLIFFMAQRVFDAWKCETDSQLRAIKLASLLVTGYFLFGSLNLPYPAIFPANLIFYLFANLVFFNKIQTKAS